MPEPKLELTIEIVETLTRTLKNRTETYAIKRYGNITKIMDPKTDCTKQLSKRKLLPFFKENCTDYIIEHKNGLIETNMGE